MVEVKDIVDRSMNVLAMSIRQGMIDRDKNATGRTSRSIEVVTTGGQGLTQGNLLANDNWKTVGSGSPPGTLANIQDLQEWQQARRANVNVFFLRRKIFAQGSKDYRERNRNVFLQAIEEWERRDVPSVEEKGAQFLMDRTEQVVLQATK